MVQKTAVEKKAGKASRRAGQFRAQELLWFESNLPRVACCGKKAVNREKVVSLKVTAAKSERTAGFSGLATCGSPWACPVCSGKIAPVRAAEIQAATKSWHEKKRRLVFLTLTMRHNKGQTLEELWDALTAAWGRVTSGELWINDQKEFGSLIPRTVKSGKDKGKVVTENRIGFTRVVEVTHGEKGWHVHIHALLFVKDGIDDDGVKNLADRIFGRWLPALTDAGLTAPSYKNGIDVKLIRRGDSHALGDYFAKTQYVGRVGVDGAGWEMAGGAGKTARQANRTPFQILADIEAGLDTRDKDLALWHEWERVSKGRRQLTWSAGLRDFLELKEEKTEAQIVAEEIGGDVVAKFTRDEWRIIRRHRAEVLAAAEGPSALVLTEVFRRLLGDRYVGVHAGVELLVGPCEKDGTGPLSLAAWGLAA
jgi:hypothetical protein